MNAKSKGTGRDHLKLHSVSGDQVNKMIDDEVAQMQEDAEKLLNEQEGETTDSEESGDNESDGEYDAGRDKTPEMKMEEADQYVIQLSKIPDEKLVGWLEGLKKIDEVRADCNDRAAKIREDAKAAGIQSVDLNAIYARYKMQPWDRKKRDAAIQRGNKAMKEQTTFDFS